MASSLRILLLLGFALSAGTVQAGPELDESATAAYNTLLHAERFYRNPDDNQIRTPEVAALKLLMGHADSRLIFSALVEEANLVGQLYALCGLYYADLDLFRQLLPRYENTDTLVAYGAGDIQGVEPALDIVRSHHRKTVRLESPDQTLEEWLQRHRPKRKGVYVLDIAGGGYPAYFRDHWFPP